MTIEKLNNDSKIHRENSPYAQILNSITINIKDNDAYRLYCYLYSKSSTWNVAKEWTSKQCNVGERKAKQCWSYLERCGLIEYIVVRDGKGKIIKHDVRVLNGTKFNPNESFVKEKIPIGAEIAPVDVSVDKYGRNYNKNNENVHHTHRCKNPPGGETTRVDIAPLLNKDLTNKDFERNKEKSFYKESNEKKHDFANSMDQIARESNHIEEHEIIKQTPLSDETKKACHELLLKIKRGIR